MIADYDLVDSKLALILAMVTFASPYALWAVRLRALAAAGVGGGGRHRRRGTLPTFFYLYLPLLRSR